MRTSLARAFDKLATIWAEMAEFWEFMMHHDRMQRQALHGTVRAAVRKVRDRL